jgi:acetolactate synthase I/III small subunit
MAGRKGDSAELSRRAPFLRIGGQQAPVAQLDSASVFGTEGYRFESCRAYFGHCESSCGVSHKVQFANRFGTPTSHLSAVRLTAQPAGAAPTMRHVLSAVVQNVPGVLAHISGMLASRGYNIDSLAVGETEDPNLSRMTFVVVGDDRVLDQVRKQLEKIVTVVKVVDVSAQNYVERDLMLLKVQAPPGGQRSEIRELVEIFRGKIVDVGAEELMIEISGRENKIEAFIERMRGYGIIELVRSGRIAMVRGGATLQE